MEITDEQIRNACKKFDLDPLGRVPVKYGDLGFESTDRADWSGDACWEIVCSMVDGNEYPEAGPFCFAAGHLSPGWRFLRELCDRIAGDDIESDWFAAFDYNEARDYLQEVAEERARRRSWSFALVCVGDLSVHEGTEDASVYVADLTGERSRLEIGELAWGLLGYAGYLVLREVFAPQIDSKNKE